MKYIQSRRAAYSNRREPWPSREPPSSHLKPTLTHLVGSSPQSRAREGVRSRVSVDVEQDTRGGGGVQAGTWDTVRGPNSATASNLDVDA